MVATPSTLAVACVALLAAPLAEAHGVISKPGLAFTGTAYGGDYSATVPMSAMPAVDGDKYGPSNSWADVFGKAFKKSKYKSLREFLMENQDMSKGRKSNPSTKECGFTAPDKQQPQPLPDKIEWYGGKQNHPGPCEAWCDDEIVLPYTVNCQESFPDGKFPYEKAKCVGKKQLTFYWMATLMEWQVYIDCSRIGAGTISGGSSNGGGNNNNNGGNNNNNGGNNNNNNGGNNNNNNNNNGNNNQNNNNGNRNNNNNGNRNNNNNNNGNRSNNNNNNGNRMKSRSTDAEDDAAVEAARSYDFGNLASNETAY